MCSESLRHSVMWTLRSYFTAFEAAHKDAGADGGGKATVARESAVVEAATDPQPDIGDNSGLPEAAATNGRHPSKPCKCGNCGRRHPPKEVCLPC